MLHVNVNCFQVTSIVLLFNSNIIYVSTILVYLKDFEQHNQLAFRNQLHFIRTLFVKFFYSLNWVPLAPAQMCQNSLIMLSEATFETIDWQGTVERIVMGIAVERIVFVMIFTFTKLEYIKIFRYILFIPHCFSSPFSCFG